MKHLICQNNPNELGSPNDAIKWYYEVIFWNQKSQVQVLNVNIVMYLNGYHAEKRVDLFSASRIQ